MVFHAFSTFAKGHSKLELRLAESTTIMHDARVLTDQYVGSSEARILSVTDEILITFTMEAACRWLARHI